MLQRLTVMEGKARDSIQDKDQVKRTLGKLDEFISKWDSHFTKAWSTLDSSAKSKASELALFGNATKSLKDAVTLMRTGKTEKDDDEPDPVYEAAGFSEFRKMWAEWFKKPRTFRMCKFDWGATV